MNENQFFVDSHRLSAGALAKKHRLEQDPASRSNHMEYMNGMEQIQSDIMEKVLYEMEHYDYNACTTEDVIRVLESDRCTIEDLKALLSPAAAPLLEQMAAKAKALTVNLKNIDLHALSSLLFSTRISSVFITHR